jgi:hypothetical protein
METWTDRTELLIGEKGLKILQNLFLANKRETKNHNSSIGSNFITSFSKSRKKIR